MTGLELVAIAAVTVAAIALLLIWWRWPDVLPKRRRDPRATTFRARLLHPNCRQSWTSARSSRDVSTPAIPASWSTPPYDWQRRPGGRHAVGLPTPAANAARAAARRDVGFLREPS